MQRLLLFLLGLVLLTIPTCVSAQIGIGKFSNDIHNTLLFYDKNKQINKFLKTAKKQMPQIDNSTLKIPIYSLYISKKYKGQHSNADSLFVYLNSKKVYLTSVFLSLGRNCMIIDEKYKNHQEQFIERSKRALSMENIVKNCDADYILVVDRDINNCIILGKNKVMFYHYDLQKGYMTYNPIDFVREFDGIVTFLNYQPNPIYYAK